MDKKEKVIYLLIGIGVLLVIVCALMFSSSIYRVRHMAWIPLVPGVIFASIGIKRWLDK